MVSFDTLVSDLVLSTLEDPQFKVQFEMDYKAAVSADAGVPSEDVIINGYAAGSVVVDTIVLYRENQVNEAESFYAQVSSSASELFSNFTTYGSVSVEEGSTITIPTPPPLPPPASPLGTDDNDDDLPVWAKAVIVVLAILLILPVLCLFHMLYLSFFLQTQRVSTTKQGRPSSPEVDNPHQGDQGGFLKSPSFSRGGSRGGDVGDVESSSKVHFPRDMDQEKGNEASIPPAPHGHQGTNVISSGPNSAYLPSGNTASFGVVAPRGKSTTAPSSASILSPSPDPSLARPPAQLVAPTPDLAISLAPVPVPGPGSAQSPSLSPVRFSSLAPSAIPDSTLAPPRDSAPKAGMINWTHIEANSTPGPVPVRTDLPSSDPNAATFINPMRFSPGPAPAAVAMHEANRDSRKAPPQQIWPVTVAETDLEQASSKQERYKMTPEVHSAALSGHLSQLQALIDFNNVNARWDDGMTALHIVIKSGHTDAVPTLLKCGASNTPFDTAGIERQRTTPLALAAIYGQTAAVQQMLLAWRVDPDEVQVALDLGIQNKSDGAAKALKDGIRRQSLSKRAVLDQL